MNKSTKYKHHEIHFHDLLEEGHNIDKFILSDSVYRRPDHNFGMILHLLAEGSVVYDIGSYIGTFSIPMAIEGMEVYAFEGFPDNFKRCKKNTKPYNVKNYLCALSDKTYTVTSKFNSCMDNDYKETRKIKYYKFDDFVKENNIPNPNLIKMDIEGMETIALHGMRNMLEDVRPIWSLGYHYKFYSTVEGYPGWIDVEDGGFDFQDFAKLGYLIYDERGYRVSPEVFNHRGGEFILIPEEKVRKK